MARGPNTTLRELAIITEFFAAADSADGHEPQPAAQHAPAQVWVTTVVDEFGPAAAHGTVDRPIPIKFSQVIETPVMFLHDVHKPTPSLSPRDLLAGVFDHPRSGGYLLSGEDTQAMNARAAHVQVEWGCVGDALLRKVAGSDVLGDQEN